MTPMHHDMGSMMTMLPGWVRLLWVIALAVVAVLHIRHAMPMTGQPRWWHGVHTAMAAGMLAMYATDPMRQSGLDRVLFIAFVAITAGLAIATVVIGRREGVGNPVWAASALDSAAMAYMSAIMLWPKAFAPLVSWIVIGYLILAALMWAFGLWARLPGARRPAAGLCGHQDLDVRLTLAVMAASMAYMTATMV